MGQVNKVALVTGAAVRLGREIALHLAEKGYDIAVHYNSSAAAAAETAARIGGLGRRVETIQADFRLDSAVEQTAAAFKAAFGRLDLLVNSAAPWPEPQTAAAGRSIETENIAGWNEALAVGARAPFFLIQKLAPLLSAARDGQSGLVINILDRSISTPFIDRAAHTVAKDALLSITRLAAKSYHGHFRVCGLELGPVLAQEAMSPEERTKKHWIGISPVLAAIDAIVSDQSVNGEIRSVA